MKHQLQNLLIDALGQLRDREIPDIPSDIDVVIEKTRDNQHGDYASNIALVLAGQIKSKPRELADKILELIPSADFIDRIEVAGPGFINFFLSNNARLDVINEILTKGEQYGCSDSGQGKTVNIEFISANPTGPLHIGHGRGAAFGAAVANLLNANGYTVDREYYINDAGRQMDILAVSVWLRYLQICGADVTLPANSYQGDYIKDIARDLFSEKNTGLVRDIKNINLEKDSSNNDERLLDDCITETKLLLGNEYLYLFNTSLNKILEDIRNDLEEFGILFENWISEQGLISDNQVDKCIEELKAKGHLYENEGALWFNSSRYGDEKDRVIVRENGQITYFASDIAYHLSKFTRGYTKAINIWGADHHGYMIRIKAALSALGKDPEDLDILLVQFASLYRGKEKIPMSTRSGQFVTLRQLREEVGKDAARFFYIMRKSDQHLDFDLDLAKSRSSENPVYYIQYAHARICSVFDQMQEKGFGFNPDKENTNLELLHEPHEVALLNRLTMYPEVIKTAAIEYEPHQLAYYLRDLANEFHIYYNACQFLVDTENLRNARLSLISGVRQVIQNGLKLLGVSAPAKM